eukprot:COSAG01_NODE_155_length_23814_cov_12.061343_13_plen_43_part_00
MYLRGVAVAGRLMARTGPRLKVAIRGTSRSSAVSTHARMYVP